MPEASGHAVKREKIRELPPCGIKIRPGALPAERRAIVGFKPSDKITHPGHRLLSWGAIIGINHCFMLQSHAQCGRAHHPAGGTAGHAPAFQPGDCFYQGIVRSAGHILENSQGCLGSVKIRKQAVHGLSAPAVPGFFVLTGIHENLLQAEFSLDVIVKDQRRSSGLHFLTDISPLLTAGNRQINLFYQPIQNLNFAAFCSINSG
jgi:hypothetical protein